MKKDIDVPDAESAALDGAPSVPAGYYTCPNCQSGFDAKPATCPACGAPVEKKGK